MLTVIFTVYVLGALVTMLGLGYTNASLVLTSRASLLQGIVILFSFEAVIKYLFMSLTWPVLVSYYISYQCTLRYTIFLNNREIKRNGFVPLEVDPACPEPIVDEPIVITNTGLN